MALNSRLELFFIFFLRPTSSCWLVLTWRFMDIESYKAIHGHSWPFFAIPWPLQVQRDTRSTLVESGYPGMFLWLGQGTLDVLVTCFCIILPHHMGLPNILKLLENASRHSRIDQLKSTWMRTFYFGIDLLWPLLESGAPQCCPGTSC